MKTFPIVDDEGQLYAFEIELDYISHSALKNVLSHLEVVESLRKPAREERGEGARLEFDCGGKDYVVWEPYGDSSCYWIGPRDEGNRCEPRQIAAIEEAFRRYRTPLPRKILADLLSLDLKRILRTR